MSDNEQNNMNQEKASNRDADKFHEGIRNHTMELVISILSDIGCQPQKHDEETILVAYQGERFMIKVGGTYAQIWDLGWANINIQDLNFENMKLAVNENNFDFGPTIVWTAPDDNGWVSLHSKREMLITSVLPNKEEYTKSVLDSFFDTKNNMKIRFQSLINQKQNPEKPNRPVEFTSE